MTANERNLGILSGSDGFLQRLFEHGPIHAQGPGEVDAVRVKLSWGSVDVIDDSSRGYASQTVQSVRSRRTTSCSNEAIMVILHYRTIGRYHEWSKRRVLQGILSGELLIDK